MAKDKSKNRSGDSSAPALPRVTRSKKRECLSAATSDADDSQETAVNNTVVDTPLPLSQQSHGQKPTVISSLPAEQSSLTKQDLTREDTPAEITDDSSKAGTVKAETQDGTAVIDPVNDSELERSEIHGDNERKQGGKEEIAAERFSRSSSDTCTDQIKGDESCALEQQETKENSECNLEQNKETSGEEHSYAQTNDVKEATEKAWAGLPARKKRRMGMCHQTDRERSHFLQAQKYENRQNRPGKDKVPMCTNAAELVAWEEFHSSPLLPLSDCIPAGAVTEESKAETMLQPSHCGSDDSAGNEVNHTTTITSDGTSCSEGKTCEASEDVVPGLQRPDDTKADPPADEQCLGSQEQLDPDSHTAESMAEMPQEQVTEAADVSAQIEQGPAIRCHSSPMINGETEDREAAALGVNNASLTRVEKKDKLICVAEDQADAGSPSTDLPTVGNSMEPCGAVVSPGGSEKNNSAHPDDRPGTSPDKPPVVHPGLGDTAFPLGPEYFDYISDSQLNTIALREEEAMETEDICPPDCPDATDLVCGLIGELSSLNRTVMATQRELENLRRSNKNSRSSIR